VNKAAVTDASRASRKGLPVLVIEDNEMDREIIVRYLDKAWPFESDMVLDQAADGREALQKISGLRYALIVLDWKLPLVGGGEVLRHIRQNGVRIPVVVLSGLKRVDIPENLDKLCAAFLNKDEMNPDTFHKAIASSLRLLGLMTV
jgi:two-component system, sensor histidine kinase and response regulator